MIVKLKKRIFGLTAGMLLLAGTAHAATYTVVPGDSLWKISVKYNTTIADLKSRNHLSSDSIYPGQKLQVPGPTPYTVQPGETLWTISRKLGISLTALINANPQLSNPNNIWTGLSIYIPDGAAVPGSSAASSSPLANGRFPLPKGSYEKPITNSYNAERYWTTEGAEVRAHEGVDILAPKGTPVYSVLDGEIVNFGWNEYGGWRVTVRVNSTTVFYYAHLDRYAPNIGMGTKLKKGQLLGYVGSTGYGPEGTEGKFVPHLHFGIYKTGASWTTIDPYDYLKQWEAKL